MIYMIILESRPIRATPEFQSVIATYSNGWYQVMNNAWLSNVDFPAQKYAELLREKMGPHDSVFVTQITSDFSGWLPQNAWDWMNGVKNLGLMARPG